VDFSLFFFIVFGYDLVCSGLCLWYLSMILVYDVKI
jgi:hypothetical protein